MIKTVNINLGRIVFQIDEDAYETLRKYLDSLTQYYKYTEGRDEIVSDIEARLAEIFTESLDKSGFSIISMGDVEEVIETMGRPEDFDVDSDLYENDARANQNTSSTFGKKQRHLYRDPDNAIIAGVSSGLAAYLGIKDALWVRIAFIALAFVGGSSMLIYILLWIIFPKAETTAQKLEMHGEAVNVNNMEKKIREEFSSASENLKEFAKDKPGGSLLRSLVNGIGKVFGVVLKVAIIFAKIVIGIILISALIGLVIMFFGLLFSFLALIPLSLKYIFASSLPWLLTFVGGILVLAIPILLLVYLPLRLFTKYEVRNKHAGVMAVGLFFAGLICLGIGVWEVNSYFSEEEVVETEETISYPFGDTLYVEVNQNEEEFNRLDYDLKFKNIFTFVRRLETATDWVELDVEHIDGSEIYLEKSYRSHGKNRRRATLNAESISHNVKYIDDRLVIDPYFGLGKNKKWRNQEVKLKLKVPDGLVIAFSNSMSSVLDNADNTKNVAAHTVAGNRWLMNEGILEPIDSVLEMGSSWSKRNMKYFNYKNFDEITLKGNVVAEIVQGPEFEVYMDANKRFTKVVDVEKNGSNLEISYHDRDGHFSIGFLGNRLDSRPKFYIVVPDLEQLNVHGLSYSIIPEFSCDDFTVHLKNQGSLYMDDIDIQNLTTDISGQSTLRLSGEVVKYVHDGSGQSNMDGEDLTVEVLDIDLSAQSDAELVVTESIDAELSGQSDFDYWGNPTVVKRTTGQSSIYHRGSE